MIRSGTLLALAVGVALSTGGAEPVRPVEGVYLALGDSLAVGVGASEPARFGYVARFFDAVRDDSGTGSGIGRLVNLAVSGETSTSLVSGGQLDEATRLLGDAAGAVPIVTLDIGGNDLLWLAASEPCASAPESDACRRAVVDTLDRFAANFHTALSRLAEASGGQDAGRVRVIVLTYYNPFSGTGHLLEGAADDALLGEDRTLDCTAAAADPDARGINDVIACVAAELGAEVADVHPAFARRGSELTLIGYGDVHANDAGYGVMAEVLEDRYRGG